MPGIYRPRHPERTVLYRVLFHHFEKFVAEYEELFERTYGYFRPIVKDVVEKDLDCGNPRCGFAQLRRVCFQQVGPNVVDRIFSSLIRSRMGVKSVSPSIGNFGSARRIVAEGEKKYNVHSFAP